MQTVVQSRVESTSRQEQTEPKSKAFRLQPSVAARPLYLRHSCNLKPVLGPLRHAVLAVDSAMQAKWHTRMQKIMQQVPLRFSHVRDLGSNAALKQYDSGYPQIEKMLSVSPPWHRKGGVKCTDPGQVELVLLAKVICRG